jgi:uncharacterized membrane protein
LDNATDAPGKAVRENPKELAVAGLALAALPVAVEQIAKRVAPKVSDLAGQAKDTVSDAASGGAKDAAMAKLKEQGPVGKVVSSAAGGGVLSKLTPGSGSSDEESDDDQDTGGGLLSKLKPGKSDTEGDDDKSDKEGDDKGRAAPGYGGGGRRMPIQQAVDVGVPVSIAYNRWTGFEDWPEFMHRFESVEQSDDTTLSFTVKMWGITRQFEAEIVEQRPDERIEWNVTEGPAHTGVVTFHELAPNLTRIQVSLDHDPHGFVEKTARGMRFTKRGVRADLHRFKALVELDEEAEEGGWRGTIEGGDVKQRTERRSGGSSKRRGRQSSNGSEPASKGRSRSSGSSGSSRSSRGSRSSGSSSGSRGSGSSRSSRSSGGSRSSSGSRGSGSSRSSRSGSRSSGGSRSSSGSRGSGSSRSSRSGSRSSGGSRSRSRSGSQKGAGSGAGAMTVDELRSEAGRLDVEGRSKMDKTSLARAVGQKRRHSG